MADPRVDEAGLKWPSLPSSSSPSSSSGGTGGFLKSLLSGGGGGDPYTQAFNNIVDIGGKIGSLFTPDKKKQTAASAQQAIEKTVLQIQDAVNNGTMDPSAAMTQLQQLKAQIATMGGSDPDMQQASMRANLIVTQVMGNIQTKLTGDLSKPIGGSLSGDVTQQKQRIGTGVRNMLAGTDAGNDFATQSPLLANLLKPIQGPNDRIQPTMDAIQSASPHTTLPPISPYKAPVIASPLKDKLY